MEDVVSLYTEKQFKEHFRMLPVTFEYLLTLLEPDLVRNTPGQQSISSRKQLMIAIWKMATPDSYRSICEKFNAAKATALTSVRKVTKALVGLSARFIVWPNEERAAEVWEGFSAIRNFPKVIGAIDGTHIKIPAPHNDPAAYINRKGYHSIQLQAVCDHQCRFIHCYVGNVGSVHDQRVFRLSELEHYVNNAEKFPADCHMLGDAAYALNEHLLTPYKDNGHLTERQKNYNFCHSSTRMTIERAFALLKGRFRSLLNLLDMSDISEIPYFIMACCVLHNICILRDDQFNDVQQILLEAEEPLHGNLIRQQHARTKRDAICEELPMAGIPI